MILTTAQLLTLRTQPHRSTMYLSIYSPTIIFEAQVNDISIGKDARVIAYDNVTVGAFTDIFANAQMIVSTTSAFSRTSTIGTVRVRSATGSDITVAENSHIDWRNNYYIRVMNYVDVEAIYPRIIPDPADEENVIFYKDYDIAYTDQNDILGSFPCAGPHRAGWVGGDHFWSASGTYNVIGQGCTFQWTFEGGSPASSSNHTPGLVTYSTPGHYKTTLAVTNASGTVDTTYRFVSVYDRPQVGGTTPIEKWEITDINGSRSSGGYSARIKVRDAVSLTTVNDNALVVIFSDDYYGDTHVSYGGNAVRAPDIFFVGYIMKGSISYNYIDNYVEFDIGSVTEVMKQAEGFSVSCESKGNPATWFQIKAMTVPRALYHYLRWHSTVLQVADFEYTGDLRAHQYFDTDRSSLYDAVNSFMTSALLGEVVADRQGKIWAEISAMATASSRTAFPVALDLENGDWIGTPVLEERQIKETSFIEMGGVVFSATGSAALLSQAPGDAPAYRGRAETIEGLILTDQTQLNQLVGNVFAAKNCKFPTLSFDLKGNYSNLDIAPIERVSVSLQPSDTPRSITFNNEPYYPLAMSWRYDAITKVRLPTLELGQLVNGVAGDTVPVPVIPDDGGFNNPPPHIPPIGGGGGGGGMQISDYYTYVYRSSPNAVDEERKRGAFSSTLQTFSFSGIRHVTVPSAGVYIAGVLGSAFYSTVSQVLSMAVGITVSPAPYFFAVNDDTQYHDHDDGGAGAIGGVGNTSTMLLLNAGDVVDFSYNMGTSVDTTLRQFSVWIVKVSD